MDQFLSRLRVLDGILETKTNILKQILNITENQRTVLTAGSHDDSALPIFAGMNEEKQKLIETLNEGDRVFQRTYREIKSAFETEAYKYAGLVRRVQERIKRVTALDTRIRVQEARNGDVRATSKKAVCDNKCTRKRIAGIYEKNKRVSPKQPPR
ncbi:MAG: hypothetical protein LBS84_04590 [Clostridiales bacterium]|jgi:flagellar biosynthesis/type III secretory pathway chaperone|nr:hypothetical protein [Clostridiales bacterium]